MFQISGRPVVLPVIALTLAGEMAVADLYTRGQLSLEWLVDSCDEICIVEVSRPEREDGPPVYHQQEPLKAAPASRRAIQDRIPPIRLRSFENSQPGDQWLWFIRHGDAGTDELVKAIDLTHPARTSYTAAITARGEVLESKDAILAAVKSRIKLGRELPERCRPDLVDAIERDVSGIRDDPSGGYEVRFAPEFVEPFFWRVPGRGRLHVLGLPG